MNYNQSILRMTEVILKKYMEIEKTGVKGLSLNQVYNASDLLIIMEIAKHGKLTTQDLHLSFQLDRGIINTIVARLMTQGLLKKQRDESDKRKAYLSLTEMGEGFFKQFKQAENEALDFVLKDFTVNEQKAVLKFLSRVNQLTVGKYEEIEE